jgi:large subunit ribosomal protein L24
MAIAKIKKGDTVRVIAGDAIKCKGKEGKVLSVDHKNGKVVVEGVNIVQRHTKPNAANANGGIIEKEAPIDISNVMYLYKGNTVRVGFQGEKKDKVRVARVNGKTETID